MVQGGAYQEENVKVDGSTYKYFYVSVVDKLQELKKLLFSTRGPLQFHPHTKHASAAPVLKPPQRVVWTYEPRQKGSPDFPADRSPRRPELENYVEQKAALASKHIQASKSGYKQLVWLSCGDPSPKIQI